MNLKNDCPVVEKKISTLSKYFSLNYISEIKPDASFDKREKKVIAKSYFLKKRISNNIFWIDSGILNVKVWHLKICLLFFHISSVFYRCELQKKVEIKSCTFESFLFFHNVNRVLNAPCYVFVSNHFLIVVFN